MYQQGGPRKAHVVPPVAASQNETQAKEKLAAYVYEYLLHTGAPKTADMFKSEMLAQHNISQINLGEPPGFLQDWWCVFWDLYSATPERRDKFEPSQEAKAFHEYGFIPPSAYPPGPMMNGMHGPPQFGNGAPPNMPPGGEPGMIPGGYFPGQRGAPGPAGPSVQSNQASPNPGGGGRYAHPGTRSGAPTPSGMPVGASPFPPGVQPGSHMFNEQMRMQAAAAAAAQQQQRNSMPPGPRMPTNFGPMRHMRPGVPPGYGPAGPQFLDSPSGTPPFPQNPMMQNGGGMCSAASLMSSPGHGPGSVPPQQQQQQQQMQGGVGPNPLQHPDGAGPHGDPRFGLMMQPGASGQFVGMGSGHHDGSGTPTSNPSSSQGNGGLGGMQQSNEGSNNPAGGGGQLQSLLNGGDPGLEMKQSPASHAGGGNVNGGTPRNNQGNPGSIQGGGGPSSAAGHGPGSVHSQSGGVNSAQGAGPHSHQTPTSEAANNLDFQMNPTGDEAASEISKIKASLINDFQSDPTY